MVLLTLLDHNTTQVPTSVQGVFTRESGTSQMKSVTWRAGACSKRRCKVKPLDDNYCWKCIKTASRWILGTVSVSCMCCVLFLDNSHHLSNICYKDGSVLNPYVFLSSWTLASILWDNSTILILLIRNCLRFCRFL